MIQERDFEAKPLQVLSFGGGVQSTAMIHLVAGGKLERPDLVMFADTGSELPETLAHIQQNVIPFCDSLSLPFVTVKTHLGDLHEYYTKNRRIPMVGIRSCTFNWKIAPQRRAIREIVGKKKGVLLAECWLGITTDEERRRTESDVIWQGLRYPLLDDLPMSREDCQKINAEGGFQPIKSGCFCCPYAGHSTWMKLKKTHPALFDASIKMEELARERQLEQGRSMEVGLCGGKPLVNLKGQTTLDHLIGIEDSECDADWGCFI